LPSYAVAVSGVAIAPNSLWIVTRDGAFFSKDMGKTWQHVVVGPPARNLVDVTYDGRRGVLIGVAAVSGEIYESVNGTHWTRTSETGWPIRRVALAGNRILGLTPYNGIIAIPAESAQAEPSSSVGLGTAP